MVRILFLLACTLTFAQTDVTNILNSNVANLGELYLGCCNDDGLSPEETNTDLCVWQDYVAYGDITLNRTGLTLRNCSLTIVDGNFITNGIDINYTCDAELIFEGQGRLAMSWEELQTLSVKELPANHLFYPNDANFVIYNLQGQTMYSGNNIVNTIDRLMADKPKGVYIIKIDGYKPTIKLF
jgi:hypothetical protein